MFCIWGGEDAEAGRNDQTIRKRTALQLEIKATFAGNDPVQPLEQTNSGPPPCLSQRLLHSQANHGH